MAFWILNKMSRKLGPTIKTMMQVSEIWLCVEHTSFEVIKGDENTPDDSSGQVLSITTSADIQTLLSDEKNNEIVNTLINGYN